MAEKKWFSFDIEEYQTADSKEIYKSILFAVENSISIMARNREVSVLTRFINDEYILGKVEEIFFSKSILNKKKCEPFTVHYIATKNLPALNRTKAKAFFYSIEIVKTLYFPLFKFKGIKPPEVHYKIKDGNLYHNFDIEKMRVEYAQFVKDTADSVLKESEIKPTVSKAKQNLSLKEVALFHIYENMHIPSEARADEISRTYGHSSGKKLKKFYDSYSNISNRIADDTKRRLTDRAKAIKNIIPLLSKENKGKAEDELHTVEEHLEKY